MNLIINILGIINLGNCGSNVIMKDNGIIKWPQTLKHMFINSYSHKNQIVLVSNLPFQHFVEFWFHLVAFYFLQLLLSCEEWKHLVSVYLDHIFSVQLCVKYFHIFCPNLLNWFTYIRQAFVCLEVWAWKLLKIRKGAKLTHSVN